MKDRRDGRTGRRQDGRRAGQDKERGVASETLAPRALLGETLAPRALLDETLAPRALLDETLAPRGLGEAGASPLRAGRVWEERPVGVRRFVVEEEYLGLGGEVYPRIVETLARIFNGQHQEAVLCWGIGSGKSYLCALALAYVLYRTLCLRNPQKHYGLAEGSPIHIVNVGPTARVAEKAVYGTVRSLVRRSPWFEQHVPDRRMQKELHFPKGIEVLPGNSSESFPLGLNVLCATMDEASYFVETADGDREAAEEVYLALQRRVKSRFGTHGLLLIASSPRHNDDFISSKLVEAEANRTIYASRLATWETKPKEKYCGKKFVCEGLKVPVELEGEFRSNPQKALRDLAARPGSAYQPFFVEMRGLEEASLTPVLPSSTGGGGTADDNGVLPRRAVRGTPPRGGGGTANDNGNGLRHPFEGNGQLAAWFEPDDQEPRFVHVDLGLRRDACGIAMAKAVRKRTRAGRPHHASSSGEGGRPVVVVELMQRIKASPGGEVDLASVRELILALRKRGFPIAQVSYDGWQSADSQQILRKQGMETKTVSVGLEAYETLKELANDGRLRMYEFKPLLDECRKLELIRGKRVDHPPGGSKDVADAVAGAVSEAVKAWGGGEEVKGRIV